MQWAKVGGYLNISQKIQTNETYVVELLTLCVISGCFSNSCDTAWCKQLKEEVLFWLTVWGSSSSRWEWDDNGNRRHLVVLLDPQSGSREEACRCSAHSEHHPPLWGSEGVGAASGLDQHRQQMFLQGWVFKETKRGESVLGWVGRSWLDRLAR